MPRFEPRLLTDKDRPGWEALWQRSPRRLVHHWDYLDAAAASAGRPIRVGIYTEKGNLAAGFCFVERRHRLVRRWAHPAPVTHGGPLLAEPPGESTLREMFDAVTAIATSSVSRAEIILPPEIADVRWLQWAGWNVTPHYNYIHRIEAEGTLLEVAENAARRQIRKGAEALEPVFGAEWIPKVLDLWSATSARQGVPAYVSPECYRRLTDTGSGDAPFSVLVAGIRRVGEDRLLAGGVFARDAQRLYYLLGASAAGENHGAPSFLHAAVTDKVFRESGPFIYDWVGANTPTIAQFKKKFRPALETGMRASWSTLWGRLAGLSISMHLARRRSQ